MGLTRSAASDGGSRLASRTELFRYPGRLLCIGELRSSVWRGVAGGAATYRGWGERGGPGDPVDVLAAADQIISAVRPSRALPLLVVSEATRIQPLLAGPRAGN